MKMGNKWTFAYTSSFRDWSNYGVGKTLEGSYSGTLTWEIVSTSQPESGFQCTVKQKFVGVASELVLRSEPNDAVTNSYDLVDTSSTFNVTVQADQIIRIGANVYPPWQYSGTLATVFGLLSVYRVPPHRMVQDTLVYSDPLSDRNVTLVRDIGPILISYTYGGNSQRRALRAELVSYTQPNGRITTVPKGGIAK